MSGSIRERARRMTVFAGVLAAGLAALIAGRITPAHASQAGTGSMGSAPSARSSPPVSGLRPGTKFTPLVASVISDPTPFKGSDGRNHLAYELLLTNVAPRPVQVDQVEVTNGRTHQVLRSLAGSALAADMNPVGSPPGVPAGTTIASSAQWVVWLAVAVDSPAQVPMTLDQRVAGSILPAEGGKPFPFDDVLARVPVRRAAPVVLSPPVGKGVWFASEGCCNDNTHHLRGLAPVDGQLMVPQRFAIDWFKLDGEHAAWVGDPHKLSSYLGFHQPVLAAANGVVVGLQNGLPNNRPPEPPPIPPIQDTVGNHIVIKAAPGVYLLYAHLQRGSLRVRVGEHVHRGQVLAKIGDSGNSTTPHLHFQIMTTPTFFPTNSQPYVFTHFDLVGQVPERIWDDNLGLQPTGVLPFAPAPRPGPRADELPLDRNVVVFP
jgi:Peptidase family M23